MKKIMILGAGIYQVPIIKKAKELGLYTIVVSIPGEYPGFAFADKVYYENTIDKEKVCEIAANEHIDGIITAGTDVAVITIGYVCDRLGLHGISYDSAMIVTDKAKMKQALVNEGVNTSKFEKVGSAEQAYDAYNRLSADGCKCIVMKIVDKSGSRGIICVEDAETARDTFAVELISTNKDYIVMEQFVDGVEIGVDAYIKDGKIVFILPHEKFVHKVKGVGIPVGHILPYMADEETYANAVNETKKAIHACGLNNCCVNVDMFIKSDKSASIIEIGGRSGATGIPEVVSLYTGNDYYELMLKGSLGEDIEYSGEIAGKPAGSMLVFSEKSGKLKKVDVKCKENMSFSLDYDMGHEVSEMKDGTDRIGQIVMTADSYEELLKNMNEVADSIVVEVE